MKSENNSQRTQISLPPTLRKVIEEKRKLTGESMAEYIRKSVLMRTMDENDKRKRLEMVVKLTAGSVDRKSNPNWSTDEKLKKWIRDLRKDKV